MQNHTKTCFYNFTLFAFWLLWDAGMR